MDKKVIATLAAFVMARPAVATEAEILSGQPDGLDSRNHIRDYNNGLTALAQVLNQSHAVSLVDGKMLVAVDQLEPGEIAQLLEFEGTRYSDDSTSLELGPYPRAVIAAQILRERSVQDNPVVEINDDILFHMVLEGADPETVHEIQIKVAPFFARSGY